MVKTADKFIVERKVVASKIMAIVFSFALVLMTGIDVHAVNSGITYQGRILKPDSRPLSGSNVQFRIQIRTPDTNNCLMYEELQSQDMRDSNGNFSLTINDGTGVRNDTSGFGLDRIFANRGNFTFVPATCSSGSAYSPNEGDGRTLVVYFKDETMSTWEPMPPQKINYVPFAFESKQVQGFTAQSIVRVQDSDGTMGNITPLSNANYTKLLDLIAGKLNGATLPAMMTSGHVLGWNGTSWTSSDPLSGVEAFAKSPLPGCAPGEFLKDNGSGMFTCATPAGTANGTVTQITAGTGLTSGGSPITTSGTIGLATLGAGGSGFNITYDSYGRVMAAVPLVEADIPVITGAGRVSGNAITSGTIGGSTAINTSGAITTTGAITGGSITTAGALSSGALTATSVTAPSASLTALSTQGIEVYETTNNFRVLIQAPASLSGNYTLTLPLTAGAPSQVLTTNGAGGLSWSTPAGTGISALTGDVAASGTGSVAATIQPLAVTNGKLAADAVDSSKIADGSIATADIAAQAVSLAKIQNIQTNRILGRSSAAAGSIEELTLGTGLALSGGVLSNTVTDTDSFAALSVCGNGFVPQKSGGVWTCALATSAGTNDAIVQRDSSGGFVAGAATLTGGLNLKNGALNAVTLAPSVTTSAYTLTLPATAGTAGYALTTDGAGALSWTNLAAGASQWTTSGSNIYYNAAGGNVGVGTATPLYKLDVAGNIRGTSVLSTGMMATYFNGASAVYTPSSSSAGTPDAIISANDTSPFVGRFTGVSFAGGGSGYIGSVNMGSSQADVVIGSQTGSTSYSEKMRLSANGNVGVGTTTPLLKLHAVGNDGTGHAFFAQSDTSSAGIAMGSLNTWVATLDGVNSNNSGFGGIAMQANGGGVGIGRAPAGLSRLTVRSYTDDSTTNTLELMNSSQSTLAVFRADGNVGIGTTTPAYKLDVNGAINATAVKINGVDVSAGGMTSLTGDVTGSGSGAVATTIAANAVTSGKIADGTIVSADLADKAVTLAKMDDIATAKLIGRSTAGTGAPEAISIGAGLSLSGGTLSSTATDSFTTLLGVCGNGYVPLKAGGVWTCALSTSAGTDDAIVQRDSSGGFVAGAATLTGGLNLKNGALNAVTLAPSLTTSPYTITLPPTAGTAGYALTTDGSGTLSWTNIASSASQWTTSGSNIYYDAAGGNVGIGTSMPADKLDVSGNARFGMVIATGNGVTNTQNTALEIGYLRSGAGTAFIDLTTNAGADYDFRIIRNAGLNTDASLTNHGLGNLNLATDDTTRMTIDAVGKVGIGTTTPSAKLHVSGGGIRSAVGEPTAANTNASGYSFDVDGDTGVFSPVDGQMNFWANNARIMTMVSGAVGIGTTTPAYKLDVAGAVNATALKINGVDVVAGGSSNLGTSAAATSPSRSGEAGTGIFSPASNQIGLAAGGTERFRVDAGGGIALTAAGGGLSLNYSAGNRAQISNSISMSSLTNDNTTNLTFSNGPTEVMRIESGRVGIGTTTPGVPLDVVGDIRGSTAVYAPIGYLSKLLGQSNSAALPTHSFVFSDDTGLFEAGGAGSHALGISTAGAERMRIDSSGKVGIGTTSPSQNLEISNSTGVIQLLTTSNATGDSHTNYVANSTAGTNATNLNVGSNAATGYGYFTTFTDSPIGFGTQNAYRMSIAKGSQGGGVSIGSYAASSNAPSGGLIVSGDVGIGTNNPSFASFEVRRSISGRAAFFQGGGTNRGVVLGGNSSNATINGSNSSGGDADIVLQPNGVANIGIGVIVPTEKLSVSGNVLATAYLYSSDRRLKKDITPIESALAKVLRLNGVTYQWIKPLNPDADREQIGVIAQDVEAVFPQAVTVSKDGTKRVNYPMLVAPIIEAVKELDHADKNHDRKIASLEQRAQNAESQVAQLKKQNAAFEARLKALEASLRQSK